MTRKIFYKKTEYNSRFFLFAMIVFIYQMLNKLAGVGRFELPYAGFRDQSLTAWRYPIELLYYSIILFFCNKYFEIIKKSIDNC